MIIYIYICIHYIGWRQLNIFVGWWSQLTNCMNSCNVLWIGCTHLQYSGHKNDWSAISQYFVVCLYFWFVYLSLWLSIWVCLKIVYPYTQWFCWSLSLLNGYFIGGIPHFQTYPFEEPGKVINIFQTTSMGHKGHVDAKAVYALTGVPSPEEITHFLKTLLNGSVPWFCQTSLSRNVQLNVGDTWPWDCLRWFCLFSQWTIHHLGNL